MSGRGAVTLGVFLVAMTTNIVLAEVSPGMILTLQRAMESAKQEVGADEVMEIIAQSTDDGTMNSVWPFGAKSGGCSTIETRDKMSPVALRRYRAALSSSPLHCGRNLLSKANNGKEVAKSPASSETVVLSRKELLLKTITDYIRTKTSQLVSGTDAETMSAKSIVNEDQDEVELESRIVGGQEAVAGKWPWLVAIGKKSGGLSCGGTIISENWILTAAHCFQEEEEPCSFNVRAGSFNWLRDSEGHHQDIEPELIVKHMHFNPENLANDVALVKLASPLVLDQAGYINAICLPGTEDTLTEGDLAVAVGWGTTEEDTSTIPSQVHEVELPVLQDKLCHFDISSKQFCAGSVKGGIDTCQGDSGGPLMVNRDNKWYLAGITSFGNGCGRALWPGIYADVGSYTDYIASVLDRFS